MKMNFSSVNVNSKEHKNSSKDTARKAGAAEYTAKNSGSATLLHKYGVFL
jgi:hypothetical protein